MNNPIAFLSGFAFKSSIWQLVANQFPDNEVLLIDLPQSEIIGTINNQLPQDCILVAWSLGGMIATELCIAFPGKYKKLVTVASTPKFVADKTWPGVTGQALSLYNVEAKINVKKLLANFQRLVNGKNRNPHFRELMQAHIVAETEQASLVSHLEFLAEADLRSIYGQLDLPVMHIYGGEDDLIPVDIADIIKQHHPDHITSVIKDAGHAPFITHAHEFMLQLLPFINADVSS